MQQMAPVATGKSSNYNGKPKDLSQHLNAVVRARKPSPIKELYNYILTPGMSNLAGGFPFPAYFPFDNISAQIAAPERFVHTTTVGGFGGFGGFDGEFPTRLRRGRRRSAQLTIPRSEKDRPVMDRIDLDTTLQYGRATGLPALPDFLREFTFSHMLQGALGYDDAEADILLTCGNTDGFSKVVGALGSRGDTMLVEEFCYTPAVAMAAPFGIGTQPVRMDEGGMAVDGPGGLRDVLENWDAATQGRRPHFMYTVTVGQNPTGITLGRQRRREIYDLCEEFDVVIIEDDPYWHMQFTQASHELPHASSGVKYPFLAALEKSYLTIDTSGRVIRLDTFSKTIAPGCRLGWITAQKKLIEGVFIAATETTTQQPSGFVQAMVAELLCRSWGMDGWVKWLESLRGLYEERMQAMAAILEAGREHIAISSSLSPSDDDLEIVSKTQRYAFARPDGGMFIWVRVLIASHPAYAAFVARGGTKVKMSSKLWDWVALTQRSLPSPGWLFAGHPSRQDAAAEHFRFCFAAIELAEVRSATERWVKGVDAFWALSAREIENIGQETAETREKEQEETMMAKGQQGGWGGFRGGNGQLDIRFHGLQL